MIPKTLSDKQFLGCIRCVLVDIKYVGLYSLGMQPPYEFRWCPRGGGQWLRRVS